MCYFYELLLVHYDQSLPIILNTDASEYGVGAVIMHRVSENKEHPIAFASKTLTSTERNYATIEKEAFAIIYAVKKFHQYLSGRKFEILTDHKPLVSIFSGRKGFPQHVSLRLQRYALILMHYDFEIYYKPGKINYVADALSRLPVQNDKSPTLNFDSIIHSIYNNTPIHLEKVAEETNKCPILSKIKSYILSNWPNKVESSIKPYFQVRNQLSINEGIILMDNKTVVPKSLKNQVLEILHSSHSGVVRMKQFGRQYCWWPNINIDIEATAKSCEKCCKFSISPHKSLSCWPEPDSVWSRLHADFAGPFLGSKWLIVVDAKSKFAIVKNMKNNTAIRN